MILRTTLLMVGAVVGDTAGAVSVDSVDGDSMSVVLNQVDVVANRADSKTPVAYTNIGKRQLTANNDGRDMTYLLNMTPSVTVSSDAGGGMGYTAMRVRGSRPFQNQCDGQRIAVE